MYYRRLRNRMSEEDLAANYGALYDSGDQPDHLLRLGLTASLVRHALAGIRHESTFGRHKRIVCADLAAGQGTVSRDIDDVRWVLGDFAPGYEITGPIEETLPKIEHVDLLLMSEIIEHVDEPETLLALARRKAFRLVLTTPVEEGRWLTGPPTNHQHYWGWDADTMWQLLQDAGWHETVAHFVLDIHSDRIIPTQFWSVR